MSKYHIRIEEQNKKRMNGSSVKEIWTHIQDTTTSETISKRIWWKDDKGVYHDGTVELPPEIRPYVDNAWIEKRRKW